MNLKIALVLLVLVASFAPASAQFGGRGVIVYRESGFTQADFPRLAAALQRAKGRWLLSLNDHPAVRSLFRFGSIQQVAARRGIQMGVKKVHELLITPNK
jgi:site-specific DNA-adenine methylase